MQIAAFRNDSPRGCFTYREWRPPTLAGLVDRLWESDGTTTEPYDRHYPHGMIELLVNVGGDRFDLVEPDGLAFTSTWLVGQQLGPTVCTQPPRHHVMGIRLRPAGAYALLGTPLRVLTSLIVALEDVVGEGGRRLVERCREATSVEARFALAAAWLSERFAASRTVDPAVAWAATEIEATHGAVPIGRLRSETGWSKTRLAAAFRDQIGVTPKVYARLVRFRRALAMVEESAAPLADVALETGYYDQPHFNAEFRELTGLSPRELLVARFPSGVPVGSTDG